MSTSSPSDEVVLRCICNKEVRGTPAAGPSWERMALLASQHHWLPVVMGEAVGMSEGTHFYACCAEHRDQWKAAL